MPWGGRGSDTAIVLDTAENKPLPCGMTDAEFISTIFKIVDNQRSLENYESNQTSRARRDPVWIRADAYDEVLRLVNRYKGLPGHVSV